MFEDKKEKQARDEILRAVKEYYKFYHKKKDFSIGDNIPYSGRVYDHEEMSNLVDSSLEFWLTSGRFTEKFERSFEDFFGVKYCSLVNSGSSANLLAFMAITSPLLGNRAIKRGDEVITVAAGFPTTVAPIIQYGAVPVFVDVTIPQYNIDISSLEKALSNKTKAIMLAHTLGNPFDLDYLKDFCDNNDLWLIEDNCDALGSKYFINNECKYTGTIGDIGTSSFYPPHHITMGEGGAVFTDDPLLSKIIVSLRDWGRDCVCKPGEDNSCGNRFNYQHGGLPLGYDHKYVYSHFGYNLKATDMQAAIGLAQLEKLPYFIQKRIYNFNKLKTSLECLTDQLILPEAMKNSKPSWFGFLITVKENVVRNELVKYLESNGIQTRMLFAGNIVKHPCFNNLKVNEDYKIAEKLLNTDKIMKNSFWLGVYPDLTNEMSDYVIKVIKNFFHKGD